MYDKRIKIFVGLIALLFLVCLLRLAQMQLLSGSYYADEVAKLKKGASRPLKTIRGRILDRKASVLAADEPRFQLCINYRLSSLLDERVIHKYSAGEIEDRHADLQQIIEKCARFKAVDPADIRRDIKRINDSIWMQRTFQAWRRNFPDSPLLKKYNRLSVPYAEAMADFEARTDPAGRRKLANNIDIAEMHMSWPLLELQTDDDIFTAQLEFLSIDDVVILPKGHRSYPYGSAAAQTIGWVGGPQEHDKEIFADDRLASYLEDDVSGREDGVEYICEAILRGRRGEVVYDIDKKLVSRTPTQFGRDVRLTLDIELQQRIESYIADCNLNPNNCRRPTAAVVIDVDTADILALVSLPVFDLNHARYDWSDLDRDPNEPLRNRAVNEQYPPGSSIKPIILIAGIESGAITPDEIIPCPPQSAPKGWPNCWIYNRYHAGHDNWPNSARNAIKGSCNIYFSRLANRIEPSVLQQWLFKFGYGAQFPLAPPAIAQSEYYRNLRQVPGIISSRIPPKNTPLDFDKFPIQPAERRFFGIGQGNLRVTPLQVANAMAAIARRGLFKLPRLFIEDPNDSQASRLAHSTAAEVPLGISLRTLDTIYDGMSAVVNEQGGTAANEFAASGLAERGVKVYGKTGSTEKPDHAWFAGFATDAQGRSISIAVVVEGGQHGSSDAAPIARDIFHFCIETGYIGQAQPTAQ